MLSGMWRLQGHGNAASIRSQPRIFSRNGCTRPANATTSNGPKLAYASTVSAIADDATVTNDGSVADDGVTSHAAAVLLSRTVI